MLECSACGFTNRDGALFCGRCGAALAEPAACPSCGAHNARENAYCDACGHPLGDVEADGSIAAGAGPAPRSLAPGAPGKILASRSALEGERKQVTVLFADVVGSTKLAERSGPEQWQQIMERFFAILCRGIHRFMGVVDRFTGDGVMAVFGAPIADEDHAAHACNAALHLSDELARFSAELRRERGLNLVVRMGLNSGEVVVGAIGEETDIKYTAVGHTVALAKRMEGLAEPGKVYLTENTAAGVEGYFDLHDLGEFDVKGVEHRVRIYELAGIGALHTPLEVARAHGLSRFVGREEESAALASALARAQEGGGQVVCVVGEAGVGKSRLLHEFAERCRRDDIEILRAYCRSRGETLPLMPVLELTRSYFGITDRDGDLQAREKIAGRVLLLNPSLRDELPLLFDFVGVADQEAPAPRLDPEARQRRLFATLRSVQVTHSRAAAVLVLEDLHWIDPGSAAFLENLVDSVPGTRTLVVCSFRPSYEADWMQRSYCSRLVLAPLAAKPTGQLLDELLGTDPSVAELSERVAKRSGGNPFFIEQLVQGLVDDGSLAGEPGAYRLVRRLGEEAVPRTVQAVIAARVDRLGDEDKRLLQTAAVIGHQFSEPVLRRVAGLSEPEARVGLRALLDAELVQDRALFPETEYGFAHQLVEEVAYGTQLGVPRRRLHGRVAAVLEELHPERLDELAALISHHLEQAGDPLAAARWGSRAAAWAGFADPAGAMRHWRRVCELTDAAGESPEATAVGTWARLGVVNFGWRLGAERGEIDTAFQAGCKLAERSGDARARALLLGLYAHTRAMAGEAATYADMLLDAIRLADQVGDAVLRAGLRSAPLALFFTGRWREAVDVMDAALEMFEQDPTLAAGGLAMGNPYAMCMSIHALTRLFLGDATVQAAREEAERGLELELEHTDDETAIFGYAAVVTISYFEGDGEAALTQANRAAKLADRSGSLWALSQAHSSRCLALVMCGGWDAATAAGEHQVELGRRLLTGMAWQPLSLSRLADAYRGAGQIQRARQTGGEAVALAVRQRTRYFELVGRLALGRALLAAKPPATDRDAFAEIEANLARTETLIDELEARGYEAFRHEARARVAAARGDVPAFARELNEAQRQWAALGARPRAERLAAEFAPATA